MRLDLAYHRVSLESCGLELGSADCRLQWDLKQPRPGLAQVSAVCQWLQNLAARLPGEKGKSRAAHNCEVENTIDQKTRESADNFPPDISVPGPKPAALEGRAV